PTRTLSKRSARDQLMDCTDPPLPLVASASVTVPRSVWSHSARTVQFRATMPSTPRPATQPPLMVLVVCAVDSARVDPPHPLTEQVNASVVLTSPQAAPPVP